MNTEKETNKYKRHVLTATDIIDSLANTITEQRNPNHKGMPFPIWKQIAIRMIADHLFQVQQKHEKKWATLTLVSVSVVIGFATLSFWGGLIIAKEYNFSLF